MTNTHTNLFLTPQTRFQALQIRNPLASSSFIYSVLTTKIYCRPTCSSRLARRANIVFHDTPAEAAAAGFRACKRCRPNDDVGAVGGLEEQRRVMGRVCGLVEREGEKKWSVKELAKEVGWTESHFCRVFKRVMGKTVGEFRGGLEKKRMEEGIVRVGEKDGGASNASTRIVLNEEDFERISNPQTSPTLINEVTTWNLEGNLDIPNQQIEFDPSSCLFCFEGSLLGSMAGDGELIEDCFEFLDFGSPPPPAALV